MRLHALWTLSALSVSFGGGMGGCMSTREIVAQTVGAG